VPRTYPPRPAAARYLAVPLLLLPVLGGCAPPETAPGTGLFIRGALLLDGTGSPAAQGALRVLDGRIVGLGEVRPEPGDRIVEARGLALAPGFIDTHSHHDRSLGEEPSAPAVVSQGITTIVVGQDGGSPFPLEEFFRGLEASPAAVNVASFVGHNTLRSRVMGPDFQRHATPSEVDAMATLLRTELDAGALGLSSGLEYDPGIHAATEEVVALARVAAEHGGRYITHLRSEDRELFDALDEALLIGREAGLPVQISHMKLAMRSLWGGAHTYLERLDRARAEGMQVTGDVYPYTSWSSTMTVLFPDRDFEDVEAARFALRELAHPDEILIGSFGPDPGIEGRSLSEVARDRGGEPAAVLLELIAESRLARERGEDGGENIVARSMDEADVERFLRWPYAIVASDGSSGGRHPRGWGAFPRVLGEYVRERGLLTLEGAVHRMTGLPAEAMGLRDRGILAPGKAADLVLFDPERVADRATFQDPHRPAEGIVRVWVAGVEVYRGPGEVSDSDPDRPAGVTGARPGRVLRSNGHREPN
jgi:N-acyl-D-amino-acid deacylase